MKLDCTWVPPSVASPAYAEKNALLSDNSTNTVDNTVAWVSFNGTHHQVTHHQAEHGKPLKATGAVGTAMVPADADAAAAPPNDIFQCCLCKQCSDRTRVYKAFLTWFCQ